MSLSSQQRSDVESIEINLLLEAMCQRWNYDFRSYSRASLERRVRQFQKNSGCSSIAEMIPRLLHDKSFVLKMVQDFSVPVTELFRDPTCYQVLRDMVLPMLRTWPHFKIWHAGCATGEEVYSLAILLKEEGLYDRATIYATDINEEALECARSGIYEAGKIQQASLAYQQAGGRKSFSDYYHARYEAVVMDATLKEQMVFSNHNLVSDSAFGEMHLILCRNVMIYFNKELQNRALGLFTESLVRGGFLCLGNKESLQFSNAKDSYSVLDKKTKIYKKKMVF